MATLSQTNYNEINAKVNLIIKEYDSTRTAHESKMKEIAAKKTIKFGHIKEDHLPYMIKEVVLYDVRWSGPLNLLVLIYFDAHSFKEENFNTNPSTTVTKVMREMNYDTLDKNNEKIKSSMVIINKTFREQGYVSTAFRFEEFSKMRTLKFNTKEYGVEY